MESVPALFMWKIKSRENKIQKGVLINDKEMERSMFLDAYVILTWTYAYHVHSYVDRIILIVRYSQEGLWRQF